MNCWRAMVSWDALEQLLDDEVKDHRSRVSSDEVSMIQERLVNKVKGSMADARRGLQQMDDLDRLPGEETGITNDPEFAQEGQRRFDGGKKADALSFAETIILNPQ